VPQPEEDLGPRWLRDTVIIDADITAMEDFAQTLFAELEENYKPHLEVVYGDVISGEVEVATEFHELHALLDHHWVIQVATSSLLSSLGNHTNRMALAAQEIGRRYRDTDALAHARVTDVAEAFGPVDWNATVPV
jgi:hypothetical protein